MSDFKSSIDYVDSNIEDVCEYVSCKKPSNYRLVEKIGHSLKRFINSPDLTGINFNNEKWLKEEENIKSLIENGLKCKEIFNRYEQIFVNEVWEQDVFSLRQNLVPFKEKWWRIFSKTYRSSNNLFAGLLSQPKKISLEEKIVILDEILEFKRLDKSINENSLLVKELFNNNYNGILKTQWDKIKPVAEWLIPLYKDIFEDSVHVEIIKWLDLKLDKQKIQNHINILNEYSTKYVNLSNKVVEFLVMDVEKRFNDLKWQYSMDLIEIYKVIEDWEEHSSEIQLMAIYTTPLL